MSFNYSVFKQIAIKSYSVLTLARSSRIPFNSGKKILKNIGKPDSNVKQTLEWSAPLVFYLLVLVAIFFLGFRTKVSKIKKRDFIYRDFYLFILLLIYFLPSVIRVFLQPCYLLEITDGLFLYRFNKKKY